MKAGERIGSYELVAPAGGMGEVWKAHDTRLDRIVALKFARAAFSDRAQREAQVIADTFLWPPTVRVCLPLSHHAVL